MTEKQFLTLLRKVWKIDKTAAIFEDRVSVIWKFKDWYTQSFKGESFPLNVCRAFLWLKYREKDHVAV